MVDQARGVGGDEYDMLRIKKQHSGAVRELIQNHLNEFPADIRNDVKSQLGTWEGGLNQSRTGTGAGSTR